MHTFLQDLRYASRQLRRSPGVTVIVVCTLALGIGVNTALFGVLNKLMLRPLPVREPQRLVSFSFEQRGGWSNGFSYPAMLEIQKQTTDYFDGMAGFMLNQGGIAIDGMAMRSLENYVTGDFFPITGIAPRLGRLISPADCSGEGNPVMVLGFSFWKGHLNSDPGVIGRKAFVNGHPVTIIGVAPPGFHGMIGMLDTDAYLPLGMAITDGSVPPGSFTDPAAADLLLFGWVKPNVPVSRLQPAMDLVASRLMREFPLVFKEIRLHTTKLGPLGPSSGDSGDLIPIAAVFLTLTSLILILACVNVANLILVRATARQRELAVRFTLGAGRVRLARQLFTETLLLGALGCCGGIVLGTLATRALRSLPLGSDLPFAMDFPFDWRVYTYAIVVALATGLLVGVFPVLRLPRLHLTEALQDGGRTVTSGGQRLRTILSVAQVAGSLILLIVAGLFVRSFENVRGIDLGFESSHVLNLSIDPHDAGLPEAQGRNLQDQLLLRLRSLPGVRSAALAASVPMGYTANTSELTVDGKVYHDVGKNSISTEYFQTMQIPFLRGRDFQASDTQSSERVAVINQAMAEQLWPGQDSIGRTFRADSDTSPIKVVGIVKNSHARHMAEEPAPYFYLHIAQSYNSAVTLQVRTATAPDAMTREIVQAIHSLYPQLPVSNVQTMQQAIATMNGSMSYQVGAVLAAGLGGLGLVLAIVGLYGVISFAVARRTAEIGLRIALGAKRSAILFLVLKQGMLIVAIGIAFGSMGAALVARLMNGLLYRVSITDPVTYLAVAFVLSLVAIAACLIPALRAASVDPTQALRTN